MKIKRLSLVLLISSFVMNACVGNASATQLSPEEILSGAYTAVALTNIAQLETAKTEVPTSTSVPTQAPTMTASATATLIQPIETPGEKSLYDGSAYINDMNIPDGTVFSPGETFTKTWKVKNIGTTIWNKYYAVAFFSGDSMSGTTTTIRRAVRPDESGNISVELTAPAVAGTYTGYWIMTNSDGVAFGNPFYVRIEVRPVETSDE